ncbi:MAG: glycosyltransferase family 4 protein [Thalassolituus oleivorans]|uniref:glycosyltransferase family 4 protein n=1 Tax=Thalassolituus oleivorans TaxID=187493 RepID=UPI001B479254|nr:glycosyltransferase family 4 protein [Thalassolituus oleivorans]MBQ0725768.1 glycosyltransferase family 4 protein [Thalassolituus oleivorans]
MNKRIVIIGTLASGVLGFRKDLIKNLVEAKYEVYVLAVDYSDNTKLAVQKLGAIPLDYKLDRAGLNPIADISNLVSLIIILKRLKPNTVFSYFIKPAVYGSIAARFANVPNIVSMIEGMGYVHTPSVSGFSFKKKVLQRVQTLMFMFSLPLCRKILVLNCDDQRDICRVPLLNSEKVILLGPIGLNLSDYEYSPISKIDEETIRFIFVGRLLEEKGINQYLLAAKKVKLMYPKSEFVVIGSFDRDNPAGLPEDELRMYVEDGTITYPGFVDNVADWISNCHVFVLPSFYREGVPRSTQEAMAIGRAVITTDSAGCRETVEDGVNGFLIPRWDVEALSNAMIEFIKSPEKCIEMGEKSYLKACREYDASLINPRLVRLLETDIT